MTTVIESTTRIEADQDLLRQLLAIISPPPPDLNPSPDPALLNVPLPGQNWPEQGGTYAGIMRGDDGTLYHLIVGPEATDIGDQPWGAYGKEEPGATSIWDGRANTRALVDSKHDHPAAQAIHQANAGDQFADWYLMAQAESSLCRATCRHLFQKTWYWTSTQYSAHNAWCQSFSDGDQGIIDKSSTGRVRAVRRLIIQ
ncbi:DUF1566 domain-containing protein [Paracandidimonas soli]|uniref:Uncharacterized protein DUF1566 n=1 Tax=Paracandidimonas soli TaxID=1917182 RepID=A0A4R3UY96_9BURK|nr:DUF1566 domain-containing protein [Paracandidimonas soli]TCU97296.1 uncharacterized protein DUF1566 [Paracandidimonas soli]